MDERAKNLMEKAGYLTTDEPRISIFVRRLVDGQVLEHRTEITLIAWRNQSHPGLVADSAITVGLAEVGWER